MAADGHREQARFYRNDVVEVTRFRRIAAETTGSSGLKRSKDGDQVKPLAWCYTVPQRAQSFHPSSESAPISLVGGGVSLVGGGACAGCPSDALVRSDCASGPVASHSEAISLYCQNHRAGGAHGLEPARPQCRKRLSLKACGSSAAIQ